MKTRGISEKWDPGPGTLRVGPIGWDPSGGTHRVGPIGGTHRVEPIGWDPSGGTHRVGPIGWDPSGGTHRVGPIGWDHWHYTFFIYKSVYKKLSTLKYLGRIYTDLLTW